MFMIILFYCVWKFWPCFLFGNFLICSVILFQHKHEHGKYFCSLFSLKTILWLYHQELTLNFKALPNNRSFFSNVHSSQGCESLWVVECFEYICQRVIDRKWELCINILSKNYRPKQVYLAWGIDLAVAPWDVSTYCSF